jgi:PhnB protein
MANKVKPIPEGYHTVTPYLTIRDAAKAIEFYKKAFGAMEEFRMETPAGKIGHAELKIGDSKIMLSEEMGDGSCKSPEALGGSPVGMMLYVENVDEIFDRAVAAGAKVTMPLADMFWGDRFGSITDPFGHTWSIATHKEDVAPDELEKRGKEAMAKMG